MKEKIILLMTIALTVGCNSDVSEKGILLEHNKNKSLKSIQYVNPNDSITWMLELDSLGNPLRLTSKNNENLFQACAEFESLGMIKSVYLYRNEPRSAKEYEFSNYKLNEITEFIYPDSEYTINQWRYLTSNEDIDEDRGFFMDMNFKDTVKQNQNNIVLIKLRGRKSLRGVSYIVNGDTMRTNNREFSMKLNTSIKGINTIQGYVSSFDTVDVDKGHVMEFRIKFNEKYFVK